MGIEEGRHHHHTTDRTSPKSERPLSLVSVSLTKKKEGVR